jgi:hypothetical protein
LLRLGPPDVPRLALIVGSTLEHLEVMTMKISLIASSLALLLITPDAAYCDRSALIENAGDDLHYLEGASAPTSGKQHSSGAPLKTMRKIR